MEVRLFRRDEHDQMVWIMQKPEAQKGQGFLRVDENIWMYDPESGKFSHSTMKETIQNSKAKSSDLKKTTYGQDYEVAAWEEGMLGKYPVYVLSLKAKNNEVSYPSLRLSIRKDKPLALKEEDYSLSGRLMRTVLFPPRYIEVAGRTVYSQMLIEDELNKGEKSQLTTRDVSVARCPMRHSQGVPRRSRRGKTMICQIAAHRAVLALGSGWPLHRWAPRRPRQPLGRRRFRQRRERDDHHRTDAERRAAQKSSSRRPSPDHRDHSRARWASPGTGAISKHGLQPVDSPRAAPDQQGTELDLGFVARPDTDISITGEIRTNYPFVQQIHDRAPAPRGHLHGPRFHRLVVVFKFTWNDALFLPSASSPSNGEPAISSAPRTTSSRRPRWTSQTRRLSARDPSP